MAAPVRKGEELALRVDSLAYGGSGVSRHDGFVVFVRGGLPGDDVRARVTKVKRGFAEGVVTEVVTPSSSRVDGTVPALRRVRRLPLPRPRVRGAGHREGAPGA